MAKRILSAAALSTLAVLHATSASAGYSFGSIPSYYEHLDFNLTSPTAFTEAVGGFANPSVYSMMPGGELEVYWSSYEAEQFHDVTRWGAFLSLKDVGFGAVHTKIPYPGGEATVTDYRLALSGGTRAFTMGLGYGWSGGDDGAFDREDLFQIGATWRPMRYVSVGSGWNLGMRTGDRREIYDVGVRPLGDQRLTLFGDVELDVVDNEYQERPRWSAGAMVEVPAGLKLIGRYFGDDVGDAEGFSVALAYSFGGGFAGGVGRASTALRYDSNDDHALTNWGIRVGFPERSNLFKPLNRNRGYLNLRVKGEVAYTTYRLFDSRQTLHEILFALEAARTDERVSGVVLSLSGAQLTRGTAWEIRRKLAEVRASGKKVIVFIDEAGMSSYYVASVADRVFMDPEGILILPGYVLGRTYIASMLDKIGVGVKEWRFLKYKSAMESLVRHEMSEADREQRQAIVDQYYATLREDVASGRGVSPETVDHWIDDVTLFTGQQALDEKLVDQLGRWEDVEEAVKKLENHRQQFVGPAALADAWYPSARWGERPQVAVVYAVGACAMDEGINARRLERILRKLRDDRTVKAVVLRVDSPGGSAMASDLVTGQLRRIKEKKPVVISQGDVAASGGYWLSMCSNQIVSQPTTITGSIGVISGWGWDKGLGEKLGMEGDFVKRGEHADLFFSLRTPVVPITIPHRAPTDEESELVLRDMKLLYEDFVGAVAENRGMSKEEVEAIAQGRVWSGVAAKENGLVDRIGGLDEAIAVARELAGINRNDEVEIKEFSPLGWFHFGVPTPSLGAPFAALGSLSTSLSLETIAARWMLGGPADPQDSENLLRDYDTLYLRRLLENSGRAQCMLPPEYVPRDEGSARNGALPVP